MKFAAVFSPACVGLWSEVRWDVRGAAGSSKVVQD